MSRDQTIQLLAQAAARTYPTEAAPVLERLRAREVAEFLERQGAPLAADVLRRLRPDFASDVIAVLSEPSASTILQELEPSLAASLVARLDDDVRATRLASLDAGLASELQELAAYEPGVAGAMMDPRPVSFRPETPAREALTRLRAGKDKTATDVFVIDEEGRLTASISVQDLALAESGSRLEDIAMASPPAIQALAPQDEVVALAADRRVTSVPVVDVANQLVGVIRHADLLSAAELDASADLQTMVGVSRDERALSSPFLAVRKRLPWLQINLATAFLAASVVGLFENIIAQFTALAVLLPVVAGQSGNTGAQALAVTMRGLALREIRARHWFRVARKELIVAAINGIAVAVVTSIAVFIWSQSVGIAAVIGTAMICSMIIAGVSGASVPMLLIALRLDPAAASSIVLTTITDVMGFLTFLGFATLAAGAL
jgi:magnesium transporter